MTDGFWAEHEPTCAAGWHATAIVSARCLPSGAGCWNALARTSSPISLLATPRWRGAFASRVLSWARWLGASGRDLAAHEAERAADHLAGSRPCRPTVRVHSHWFAGSPRPLSSAACGGPALTGM